MIQHEVTTPHGAAQWTIDPADDPKVVLALGHGASGGVDAFDLEACAALLPERGVTVARYLQPYRFSGRGGMPSAATLDEGFEAGIAALRELVAVPSLVTGGRSAGARVACRTATRVGARGVVCLAFPLHPPGKPEKSRAEELLGAGVPVLVLQGSKDPFGTPEDVTGVVSVQPITVVGVEKAAHDLKVGVRTRPADEHRVWLADHVGNFLLT